MSRDPRYARIFDSRPLLPALAAIAHNWLDLQSSLKVISALSVALAGLLLALTLRVAKLSWPVALGAQVLISFTPFAAWGIRPFTEGISGLGLAAFVLGVALTTVGRVRSGLAVTLAAAAFLVASRSHVAVLAGLAALVCLLVSAKGRALLRRWPVVTGPAAAVIGGIAVPTALGWPGLADSLQDLATVHFAKHDSAQPWRAYLRFLRTFALELLSQPVLVVGILAFAAVLVTAIAAKPTPAMLVAIIAPVAVGLGNTLAHPVIGTAARLFSPAWLGLVAALAVLTAASIDAFRARRSRAAQPG